MTELIFYGPENAGLIIVLAHGAGAPMDSPFMEVFAKGLAGRGHRVVRFEFPYMAGRRETGKKKPPDRQPVLLETWRQVVAELGGGDRVVIGGKSMGGRMASLVADDVGTRGLVCLGYPFHAPGRPEKPRTEHLTNLHTPTLILQGTRDPFGKPEEVAGYVLSKSIGLCWVEDGDHNLEPRKKSGRTTDQNWQDSIASISGFVGGL